MCQKLPYCNRKIDSCLVNIIQEINNKGIFKTVLSCCGHGKYPSSIIVRDREGNISEYFTSKKLEKRKRHRYYKRDKKGYYYVQQMYDGNTSQFK